MSKLGYIAWNEQQYDTAIAYFERVLQRDPKNASAYIHLGVNYVALEQFDVAMAAYREARASILPMAIWSSRVATWCSSYNGPKRTRIIPWCTFSSENCTALIIALTVPSPPLKKSLPWLRSCHKVLSTWRSTTKRMVATLKRWGPIVKPSPLIPPIRKPVITPKNSPSSKPWKPGQPTQLTLDDKVVLEVSPHSAPSYYHLGLRYLRNDEVEAAIDALQQAVRLRPDYAEAHLFLGLAYTSLGTHHKAEVAYQRATVLNPTDPQAYNYLGLAYHQQKRYHDAITAYRQAIARNANYALAYANLGASYEALGKLKDAQAAYHQAWQRDAGLEFAREKMEALRQQSKR